MPKSKPSQTELSIIIVSYNTAALTVQTIESAIEAATQKSRPIKTEIIVVDNDSQDTSVTDIKRLAKQSKIPVNLIENKTNDGFAAANNQGIKVAKGKYILLLNSDTVVKPKSLINIVKAFEENEIDNTTADLSSYGDKLDKLGIQAATLLNQDGSPQPQGGSFPTLWSLFSHMMMLDDLPIIGQLLPSTQHTGKRAENHAVHQSKKQHLHQKDWVGGTAMAIRKEVIEQIGDLDEKIFMYGEDVEYCMRAKNHHWDVAENIDAPIIHYGNASGSSKRAIVGELTGYLYIWSKHKPHWQYPLVKAMILLGCQLRAFLFGTILGNQLKKEIYQQAVEEIRSYA
jgi:GT2 family glycosyltransferase